MIEIKRDELFLWMFVRMYLCKLIMIILINWFCETDFNIGAWNGFGDVCLFQRWFLVWRILEVLIFWWFMEYNLKPYKSYHGSLKKIVCLWEPRSVITIASFEARADFSHHRLVAAHQLRQLELRFLVLRNEQKHSRGFSLLVQPFNFTLIKDFILSVLLTFPNVEKWALRTSSFVSISKLRT